MTAAAVQADIYAAFGEVAAELGTLHTVYRPASAAAPLANPIGTLLATFSNEDTEYARPAGYGDATWFGWFNGATTQPGDYLVGARTWFIAAQQPMLPILAVECSRTVRIARSDAHGAPGIGTGSAVGAMPYGGLVAARSETVAGQTGAWPASLLITARASRSASDLPTAVGDAIAQVLLPVSLPGRIHHGDVLVDDLGRRFAVSAAELSALGWRLHATEIHA